MFRCGDRGIDGFHDNPAAKLAKMRAVMAQFGFGKNVKPKGRLSMQAMVLHYLPDCVGLDFQKFFRQEAIHENALGIARPYRFLGRNKINLSASQCVADRKARWFVMRAFTRWQTS